VNVDNGVDDLAEVGDCHQSMQHPSEHTNEDVAGWFWSEKIDGFGCEWNGSAFLSRSGNEYDVPADWAKMMPEKPVHGELFSGSWSATNGAVKRGDWSAVRFHVFDRMSKRPLLERLATMPALPDFCRLVDHAPVFSTAHAKQVMQDVVGNGGEGIVVRRPDVGYHNARTLEVLKMKPWQDTEATILRPCFASYTTIPSSHLVRSDDGYEFKLRGCPRDIAEGARVTFKFCGRNGDGIPKHSQFMRVA
jgi:DNA ligase 1